MELINNINKTLRDDIVAQMKAGSRLSIAASCFSIYAFQELKEALKDIKELRFIFTSPTWDEAGAGTETKIDAVLGSTDIDILNVSPFGEMFDIGGAVDYCVW